tara:strand:+ start:3075 stop:3539 length:465 start_codon:yes stop_codon:yes gene_type:complete
MELTTKIIADKVIEILGYDIRSNSRLQKNVRARYIYAKLCNDLLFDTLTNIGKEINRDHATILHYLRKTNNEYIFTGDLVYNHDLVESDLMDKDIDVTDKYLKEVKEEYRKLNSKFTMLTKKHLETREDYNLLKSDYQRLLLVNLKLKKKYKLK